MVDTHLDLDKVEKNAYTDNPSVRRFSGLFSPLTPLSHSTTQGQSRWLTRLSVHHHRLSTIVHSFFSDNQNAAEEILNHQSSYFNLERFNLRQKSLPDIFDVNLAGTSAPDLNQSSKRLRVNKQEIGTNFHRKKSLPIIFSQFVLGGVDSSSSAPCLNSPRKIYDRTEFLMQLDSKGYQSLARKLEKFTGDFWDDLVYVKNPLLIEQVVDIHLLCNQKFPHVADESTRAMFISFALNLSLLTNSLTKSSSHHSHTLIDDAKEIQGQLIYLLNHNPINAYKAVNESHFKDAVSEIKKAFSYEIKKICIRLDQHYKNHSTTGFQSADRALHNLIPFELSQALITDVGTFNIGIIPILRDIFLSQESDSINYEINLSYTLKLFEQSPLLRSILEQISLPDSLPFSSIEVITTCLHLLPFTPITKTHFQITLLTALLSRVRQEEEDGSCFAISNITELLSSHINFCLPELYLLLSEGCLAREINKNVTKDITFINKIHDENLKKPITFNARGQIILQSKRKEKIWKAPGIQAACRAIGILDTKQAVLEVIKQLSKNKKDAIITIQIGQFLTHITENFSQQKIRINLPLQELYKNASFAFSAQLINPLLKAWENVIASMAEAKKGMNKTRAVGAIMDALQYFLADNHVDYSPILGDYLTLVQSKITKDFHYFYDPAVSKKNDTKFIEESGFVLYHTKERIDCEDKFRRLLLTVLSESRLAMLSHLSSEEHHELDSITTFLMSLSKTSRFMGYLLIRFHPEENHSAVNRLFKTKASYDCLNTTPWISKTGNHSKTVLKLYYGLQSPLKTKKFTNSNTQSALTNIINMCREMPAEEKRLFLKNPNKLKPFWIVGKHRLPFMAGHHGLVHAWQSHLSTEEWINQNVINPGLEIANSTIDCLTQQNFLATLEQHVLPQFIAKKGRDSILIELQKISIDNVSIKDYRSKILEVCKHKVYESLTEALSLKIDSAFCQALEPRLKVKLEKTAVIFADTNWYKNQDIYLAFAVNPGTGVLQLWQVHADGTNLVAVDEDYWIKKQTWEFLNIPDKCPDDSIFLRNLYT